MEGLAVPAWRGLSNAVLFGMPLSEGGAASAVRQNNGAETGDSIIRRTNSDDYDQTAGTCKGAPPTSRSEIKEKRLDDTEAGTDCNHDKSLDAIIGKNHSIDYQTPRDSSQAPMSSQERGRKRTPTTSSSSTRTAV